MKRTLPVILLLICMACQNTPGNTPPTLNSSVPASGATNIAITTKLTLVFSKDIAPDSLQVSSSPAINLGQATWNDPKTAIYSPLENWQAGTTYTLTIQAKDSSGNTLSKTLSFTTQTPSDSTPPAIPQNVTATAANGNLSISWSANSEADLSGYTVFWGLSEKDLSPMSFVTHPELSATFTGLETLKTYYYAVEALDTSNNASEKSVVASILMQDTIAPTLISSEPTHLSENLSLIPKLRFSFSESMSAESIGLSLCESTVSPSDANCTIDNLVKSNFGTPIWNTQKTSVEYNPTSNFQGGKTYTILVSAKDLAGNELSGQNQISFSLTTLPDITPPTVPSMSMGADPITNRGEIAISFSEAMDQESVQEAFLSSPILPCTLIWEVNTAKCSVLLEESIIYTLTIGTGAKDLSGNSLLEARSAGFSFGGFSPIIKSYSPSGRFGPAMNVDILAPITVRFSEAMNQAITQNAFSAMVNGVLQAGTFNWASKTEMIYTPSASYGYGQTVSWKITVAAKDTDGQTLGEEFSQSFTTKLLVNP